MPIHTWGVVGTGPLARGIAELATTKGFEVIMVGYATADLESARLALESALDHEIERWAITDAEKRAAMSRMTFTTEMNRLSKADFVIVALVTDIQEDRKILRALDQICDQQVIFASNTSTLSITEMAAATARPDRVIGCHFLSPIMKSRVVEIVRGLKTAHETVRRVKELMAQLDRAGIEVYESTGYVSTRMIIPLINEACQIMMEGVATAADIDTAMQLGFEMARGPLEIADRTGLDTVLVLCERLWREYGDMKYRPAPILRKLVRAGHVGVESGEGFFRYDKEGNRLKEGESAR